MKEENCNENSHIAENKRVCQQRSFDEKMTSMAIPKAMQNGWSQSIFVLSELFLPTETLTERVHAR